LSPQDALNSPYIASMGVYVFKKDVLLKLLKWRYPTSNDFGSEIIPSAIKEHNVQVRGIPIKVSAYKCFYPFKELITPIPEVAMKKKTVVLQAYFFGDYWEDIGTIKSFYDANLALTKEVGARNFQCSCSVQLIETTIISALCYSLAESKIRVL
jgi:glucose-1-phosphate adenylyltransferase